MTTLNELKQEIEKEFEKEFYQPDEKRIDYQGDFHSWLDSSLDRAFQFGYRQALEDLENEMTVEQKDKVLIIALKNSLINKLNENSQK